eukprot:COSAG05_NODE_420_length_9974_cov_12.733975_14_plen_83_part_00
MVGRLAPGRQVTRGLLRTKRGAMAMRRSLMMAQRSRVWALPPRLRFSSIKVHPRAPRERPPPPPPPPLPFRAPFPTMHLFSF